MSLIMLSNGAFCDPRTSFVSTHRKANSKALVLISCSVIVFTLRSVMYPPIRARRGHYSIERYGGICFENMAFAIKNMTFVIKRAAEGRGVGGKA